MPNEGVYIDTNVLGAYYCPEPLSAAAEYAIRGVAAPVISILCELEFCSLVARKRRLKELSERHVKQVLDLFASHIAEGFYRRVVLTAEHYLKARQLIESMDIRLSTLDALHLAAAAVEGLVLFTADRELASAAKRHRQRVKLIKSR